MMGKWRNAWNLHAVCTTSHNFVSVLCEGQSTFILTWWRIRLLNTVIMGPWDGIVHAKGEVKKTLYCIMTQVYIHLHHPSLILLCSMKLILESFQGTVSFVDLILDPLMLWKHVQQAVVVNIKDSCVAACCRFPWHPCKCHRPWVVSWLQFCGTSLARGEQAPWRSPGQPDQPGQGRSSVKPSVSWQLAVLQAWE